MKLPLQTTTRYHYRCIPSQDALLFYLETNHYRPQRSCEGYVFTPVCHSVHKGRVCLSACWDATPPPSGSRHPPPPEQRRLLLWTVRILLECILVTCLMFTARKRSLGQGNVFISVCDSVHGGVDTPPLVDTPNPLGYYGIRSTSGRYASYWNAYLFILSFHSL